VILSVLWPRRQVGVHATRRPIQMPPEKVAATSPWCMLLSPKMIQRLQIPQANHRTPRSILVVDDDLAIVHLLKKSISAHDPFANVMGSQFGRSAQEMVKLQAFDLLITDLRMPEVDGFELIRTARLSDPDLPVIIITGVGLPFPTEPTVTVKNCVFMQKPFEFSFLMGLSMAILLKERGEIRPSVNTLRVLRFLQRVEATCLLRVVTLGKTALFSVQAGYIHYAVTETLEGLDALAEAVEWSEPEQRIYQQVCNEDTNIVGDPLEILGIQG